MDEKLHLLLKGLNDRLNSLLRCYISLKIRESPLQRYNGDFVPTYTIRYDLVSGIHSLDQWWDVYNIGIEYNTSYYEQNKHTFTVCNQVFVW